MGFLSWSATSNMSINVFQEIADWGSPWAQPVSAVKPRASLEEIPCFLSWPCAKGVFTMVVPPISNSTRYWAISRGTPIRNHAKTRKDLGTLSKARRMSQLATYTSPCLSLVASRILVISNMASSVPTPRRQPCWDGCRYPPVRNSVCMRCIIIATQSFLSTSRRAIGRRDSRVGSAVLGIGAIHLSDQWVGKLWVLQSARSCWKTKSTRVSGHNLMIEYVSPERPGAVPFLVWLMAALNSLSVGVALRVEAMMFCLDSDGPEFKARCRDCSNGSLMLVPINRFLKSGHGSFRSEYALGSLDAWPVLGLDLNQSSKCKVIVSCISFGQVIGSPSTISSSKLYGFRLGPITYAIIFLSFPTVRCSSICLAFVAKVFLISLRLRACKRFLVSE